MIEAGVEPHDEVQQPKQPLHWFTRRRFFWIVLLLALGLYAQTRFWQEPSGGDRANWDYMAQVVGRGGVPYRDAVNIKTPLSAYIGAAAIWASKPFGFDDVIAVRIAFVLLAAAVVAMTFLVTHNQFDNNWPIALLASAVMLSWDSFLRFNGGGVQPKTPMILFGLVSLWAVVKDRPFTAGLCGMLSALSWQPGLLLVGVAGLSFSRYFTSWREGKLGRLIVGAAIPLAAVLA